MGAEFRLRSGDDPPRSTSGCQIKLAPSSLPRSIARFLIVEGLGPRASVLVHAPASGNLTAEAAARSALRDAFGALEGFDVEAAHVAAEAPAEELLAPLARSALGARLAQMRRAGDDFAARTARLAESSLRSALFQAQALRI